MLGDALGEGEILGDTEGLTDGLALGEGLTLGDTDGDIDGLALALADGDLDTDTDGDLDAAILFWSISSYISFPNQRSLH